MSTPTLRFIFIFMLCFGSAAHAQFAFGPKLYTRTGDDHVGQTAGAGFSFLYLDYDSANHACTGLFGGGFDISFPQKFTGTATMDATDSSTSPYTASVLVDMQVTDFFLRFDYGFAINPQKKKNALILSLGLRPLYRRVKIRYPDSFNESAYSRYTLETSPDIPAALNIGINVGAGYLIQANRAAFYPNISFGFGAADSRNKHPWNRYPNHIEAGITVLFVTRIE